MTSLLPVAVTKMSAVGSASSMVCTEKPSIAACSAQMGSISVTITRAPAPLQRLGRALADIAIAADNRDLAGHHHIGAAADGIDERFAAAIFVVEFRLGDAVIDIDRGKRKLALLLQVIKAVHAGRRLLGDALDRGLDLGEPAGARLEALCDLRDRGIPLPRSLDWR